MCGAKRRYKVLIKGPWDGIEEDLWELSDDVVEKFVDEENYAYAIACYEKGELIYRMATKKFWERQEQMLRIMMDQNLSPEMKQGKILSGI